MLISQMPDFTNAMGIHSEGHLSEKKELCSFLDVCPCARAYIQRQETCFQSFLKGTSTTHFLFQEDVPKKLPSLYLFFFSHTVHLRRVFIPSIISVFCMIPPCIISTNPGEESKICKPCWCSEWKIIFLSSHSINYWRFPWKNRMLTLVVVQKPPN